MSKPTQKATSHHLRKSNNTINVWQTFPLIILVPSTLIVSFCILIQFFPEPSNFRAHFFRSANMSAKKEGRLSPSDPNSYARPGNTLFTMTMNGVISLGINDYTMRVLKPPYYFKL